MRVIYKLEYLIYSDGPVNHQNNLHYLAFTFSHVTSNLRSLRRGLPQGMTLCITFSGVTCKGDHLTYTEQRQTAFVMCCNSTIIIDINIFRY